MTDIQYNSSCCCCVQVLKDVVIICRAPLHYKRNGMQGYIRDMLYNLLMLIQIHLNIYGYVVRSYDSASVIFESTQTPRRTVKRRTAATTSDAPRAIEGNTTPPARRPASAAGGRGLRRANAHVLTGPHVVCVNHARRRKRRFRNGG